jgi:hypothetical protein
MEREEGVVYAMMGGAGGVMFGKLRKNWMGGWKGEEEEEGIVRLALLTSTFEAWVESASFYGEER